MSLDTLIVFDYLHCMDYGANVDGFDGCHIFVFDLFGIHHYATG